MAVPCYLLKTSLPLLFPYVKCIRGPTWEGKATVVGASCLLLPVSSFCKNKPLEKKAPASVNEGVEKASQVTEGWKQQLPAVTSHSTSTRGLKRVTMSFSCGRPFREFIFCFKGVGMRQEPRTSKAYLGHSTCHSIIKSFKSSFGSHKQSPSRWLM